MSFIEFFTHCCCLQALNHVSPIRPAIAKMQFLVILENVENNPDPYLPMMWNSPSNLFARMAARSPLTVRPSQKHTTTLALLEGMRGKGITENFCIALEI